MAIPDHVKDAARAAVEPMHGMVMGGKDADISDAERSNAYANQPEHARGGDYDTQLARAIDQEKAIEKSMNRERDIEQGRDR